MKNICRASGIHVNKGDEYSHPVKAIFGQRPRRNLFYCDKYLLCNDISLGPQSHS